MKLTDKILISCLVGGGEAGLEYARLYELFVEVKPATVRSAVKRLSDERKLNKVQKNQAWWLMVSNKGERKLVENYPVIDKIGQGEVVERNDTVSSIVYTIVVYTVAEKDRVARDMWRRYLVEAGLVRLKQGVFVGFGARVGELVEKLAETEWGRRIAGSVMMFEAGEASLSASQLAEKMYDMRELYSRYLLFVSQVEGVLRAWRGQKGAVDMAKVRSELVEKYFELVESDPGLPWEGYTEDWRFGEATGLFRELVRR